MDDEAGTTNGNSGAKLGEQASQRLAEMRGEIGHLDRRTRRFVQDRPLTAVLTAVAGGYLLTNVARAAAGSLVAATIRGPKPPGGRHETEGPDTQQSAR
jgi:hypothetical protein